MQCLKFQIFLEILRELSSSSWRRCTNVCELRNVSLLAVLSAFTCYVVPRSTKKIYVKGSSVEEGLHNIDITNS
jgi:hypothetical protein